MEDDEEQGVQAQFMNLNAAADFVRQLYIFERDSKYIHVFDL